MKKGWSYKKLGEVGATQTGTTPSKAKSGNYGDFMPFIRPAEIPVNCSGKINYNTEIKLSEEGVKNGRLFKANSILMVCIGSIGKLGYLEQNASCNQQINVLTPNADYNSKYIFYAMSAPAFQKESMKIAQGSQATLPIINKSKWSNLLIPIPPSLSEQQHIVSRLDSTFAHIDTLKANAEKQLREARALFQKALERAMEPKEGWEENTIGNIFQTYAGGTPLKSEKDYYDGGAIPWIRSGEVCQKYINDCELYITEKGMSNSSAKYYPINTILVAMYGATAAQVGILKFKATSNQAVCGILPHKDFVPEYIYYWFSNIQKDLASQAQGGAQPNLSQVKIKKVKISYPHLSDQQHIVARLDSLSANLREFENIQRKIIAECDALKQALLRKVFE